MAVDATPAAPASPAADAALSPAAGRGCPQQGCPRVAPSPRPRCVMQYRRHPRERCRTTVETVARCRERAPATGTGMGSDQDYRIRMTASTTRRGSMRKKRDCLRCPACGHRARTSKQKRYVERGRVEATWTKRVDTADAQERESHPRAGAVAFERLDRIGQQEG